jgi:hypothetical protein
MMNPASNMEENHPNKKTCSEISLVYTSSIPKAPASIFGDLKGEDCKNQDLSASYVLN